MYIYGITVNDIRTMFVMIIVSIFLLSPTLSTQTYIVQNVQVSSVDGESCCVNKTGKWTPTGSGHAINN